MNTIFIGTDRVTWAATCGSIASSKSRLTAGVREVSDHRNRLAAQALQAPATAGMCVSRLG